MYTGVFDLLKTSRVRAELALHLTAAACRVFGVQPLTGRRGR